MVNTIVCHWKVVTCTGHAGVHGRNHVNHQSDQCNLLIARESKRHNARLQLAVLYHGCCTVLIMISHCLLAALEWHQELHVDGITSK